MNSIELLKYVFFLSKIKKLGNARIKSILNHIKSLYDFSQCSRRDLRKIEGIDESISFEIISSLKNFNEYEREFHNVMSSAERKNVSVISVFDGEYPENLKRVFDSPVILYYKGKLDTKDKYSISIVGTRNPTEYGKYTCEKFTERLSELGIPIISGFARGIDSRAHSVCLKNNNLTYAVLGSGVDVVYPADNRRLYHELIERGAIISEYPVGSLPEKVNFPKRNRIISGISLGSLIVESGIKGGSLLTAGFAIDQNREVFAVPGYINSKQSEGTNELIKSGHAKLVTNVDDILTELESKLRPVLKKETFEKQQTIFNDLSSVEKIIYEVLDCKPVHIDEINEATGLTISECLVNLLSMEFKGVVRQIPGKNFIKV